MILSKALVRSKFLAALALSRRSCDRAQNVLSAAQFCAHFKNLKIFQLNFIQDFFASKQAYLDNISLILKIMFDIEKLV